MLNFFIKNRLFKYIREVLLLLFCHITQPTIILKLRSHARKVALIYDLCAVMIAWMLSCWIVIDTMAYHMMDIPFNNNSKIANNLFFFSLYWRSIVWNLCWILPLQYILFIFFNLYRGFWRFASTQDLQKICYASVLGGFIAWLVLRMGIPPLLLPQYIIAMLYGIFLIFLLSSARLAVRFAKSCKRCYGDYQRVIIVGAGKAGEGLVRDLLRDDSHRYKPVVFTDDDIRKIGREIHGIRVVGTLVDLTKFIDQLHIDLVLIAMPSASSAIMRSVLDICEKSNIKCYTLPGIKDLANGRVSIDVLRSISLEDLLGRYPVTCQLPSIKTNLKNKTVLITGGGGSIGSELCRQIAYLKERTRLVIADSNEYNLYSIDMELRQQFPFLSIFPVLIDITNRYAVQRILKTFCPTIVFHAAAYKHVPLLEHQPRVAISNNIIGTCTIAEESTLAGVETFVLISTDKAVNPTNIMGATKRAAEYFCQNLNDHSMTTRFVTVRFGNVLNSAGSVVPLFKKQIESGGPVTVTHPEISRFFMTIPEASQLILQAAFLGQGGEIFVLDMGEPVKIKYLAEQMIKMAGKVINDDIKIIYTGLRPGEKLYEECFYPNETLQPTLYTKILRAKSYQRDFEEIRAICKKLEMFCHSQIDEESEMITLVKKLVPEYQGVAEENPITLGVANGVLI